MGRLAVTGVHQYETKVKRIGRNVLKSRALMSMKHIGRDVLRSRECMSMKRSRNTLDVISRRVHVDAEKNLTQLLAQSIRRSENASDATFCVHERSRVRSKGETDGTQTLEEST